MPKSKNTASQILRSAQILSKSKIDSAKTATSPQKKIALYEEASKICKEALKSVGGAKLDKIAQSRKDALLVRASMADRLAIETLHKVQEQREEEAQFKKLEEEMNSPVVAEEFGEFQGASPKGTPSKGTPPITAEKIAEIAEQLDQSNKRDAVSPKDKLPEELEAYTKELHAKWKPIIAANEKAAKEKAAKETANQIEQDQALAVEEQAKEIATKMGEVIAEEVQKNEAVVKRIERILDGLVEKIEGIGQNHPEARSQAVNLHNTLMVGLNTLEEELKSGQKSRKEATDDFKELCSATIMSVMPALEKDLGWGEYLKNMLKSIANVFIAGVQKLGSNATFFNTSSKSSQAVDETGQELQADDDQAPSANI